MTVSAYVACGLCGAVLPDDFDDSRDECHACVRGCMENEKINKELEMELVQAKTLFRVELRLVKYVWADGDNEAERKARSQCWDDAIEHTRDEKGEWDLSGEVVPTDPETTMRKRNSNRK